MGELVACDGFSASDRERALNTLRYIHGNPKATKMRSGFFYEFSNYGSYDQLSDDGLTQWHPAFLQLGSSLEDCTRKYRGFCQRYKPKSKPARMCNWGNKLLAGFELKRNASSGRSREGKGSREGGKREGNCPNLETSVNPTCFSSYSLILPIPLIFPCPRLSPYSTTQVPGNEKPNDIGNRGAIHPGESGSWKGEEVVLRGN